MFNLCVMKGYYLLIGGLVLSVCISGCSPEEQKPEDCPGTGPVEVKESPAAGELLISELLYEAVPPEAEYVELYNPGNFAVSLNKVFIGKRNGEGKIISVKRLTEQEKVIAPGEVVWISPFPEKILTAYAYHCKENCLKTDTRLSYSDQGGSVVVLNEQKEVVDELTYGKFLHNPLTRNTKRVALERKNYDRNLQGREAWTSAAGDAESGFGSPGRLNRAIYDPSVTKAGLFCLPEVFTPDGDGREDELKITVNCPESCFTLKLSVFDERGKTVCLLTEGCPVDTQCRFSWDGKDKRGKLLSAGIYIICAELTTSAGKQQVYKKVCVLAR